MYNTWTSSYKKDTDLAIKWRLLQHHWYLKDYNKNILNKMYIWVEWDARFQNI